MVIPATINLADVDAASIQNGTLNVVSGLGVCDNDETFLKLAFSRLLQDQLLKIYGTPNRGVIFFDQKKHAVGVRVYYSCTPRQYSKSLFSAYYPKKKITGDHSTKDSIIFEYSPVSRVRNVAMSREFPKEVLMGYSFPYNDTEPQWGVI